MLEPLRPEGDQSSRVGFCGGLWERSNIGILEKERKKIRGPGQ